MEKEPMPILIKIAIVISAIFWIIFILAMCVKFCN